MVSRLGLFVRAFVFESVETQFWLSETSEPIIFLISDWSTPGRTKSSNKMWNESFKLPYWSPSADLNVFLDAKECFQINAARMALKSLKVGADERVTIWKPSWSGGIEKSHHSFGDSQIWAFMSTFLKNAREHFEHVIFNLHFVNQLYIDMSYICLFKCS